MLAGVSALLILAIRVSAGPLPEHWVAEGSDWVVHVDAERLREAEALRPAFDALVASAWGSSLSDMGIDARSDLTGITMFGTITRGADAKGQTTTMLRGGAALREAIQKHVDEHEGHPLLIRRSRRSNGGGISAWTIESLSIHVALVPVGQNKNENGDSSAFVAVLSDHSERLQDCIGLLLEAGEQAKPSHPEEQAGEGRPSGCVIIVRAKDLDHAHPPLRSALLASAEKMEGHLGYRVADGATVVFAKLRVEGNEQAETDRMVSSLNDMIDFWTHKTQTMTEKAPALQAIVDLIDSSKVTREDQVVELAMEGRVHNAAPANEGLAHGSR